MLLQRNWDLSLPLAPTHDKRTQYWQSAPMMLAKGSAGQLAPAVRPQSKFPLAVVQELMSVGVPGLAHAGCVVKHLSGPVLMHGLPQLSRPMVEVMQAAGGASHTPEGTHAGAHFPSSQVAPSP